MVEAPVPIDLAPGTRVGEGRRKQMRDPLAFVHHIGDLDSTQEANIARLATGGGVKGGLVEVDPARIIGPLYHCRLEIAKV
jgi:hypothetical protein